METVSTKVKFYGEGGKYFGIVFVNLILTVITFGIYYPWARARNLQYLYGETEFAGSRLTFHGTGKEMFKGFIKAVAIILVLVIIYQLALLSKNTALAILGSLVYALGLLTLIPLAIHGGLRYRMSRTSWRGIHFGYRGDLRELFMICFKGALLTILTLGIYGSWFVADLRKYITTHVRLGNVKFDFDGTGMELFLIGLKGFFLSILTLGIYMFWWMRNVNHYHINHTKLEQDGQQFSFRSNLQAGEIFMIAFTSYLLIIFTLGLAAPWVLLRQMRMVLNNVELEGAFNAETVAQTEEVFTDATGEDLLDMLDIGIDF